MGTPEHPEGVQHWTSVALYAHKLSRYLQQRRPFWLLHASCCERYGPRHMFVENILRDVTAVKRETNYGGFRPDILLERGGKRPTFLEFVHTSKPSDKKLAYCRKQGVVLFELGRAPATRPEQRSRLTHPSDQVSSARPTAAKGYLEAVCKHDFPTVLLDESKGANGISQAYKVGGRTVTKNEFQSILMVLKYVAHGNNDPGLLTDIRQFEARVGNPTERLEAPLPLMWSAPGPPAWPLDSEDLHNQVRQNMGQTEPS